ncbi:unnamed protein product [Pleuronectes platessa]|uniref:Uncharacterized protein n=1 Tax=Pleuronectes platessa TaxID=8262 RepID=A0A9N7TIM7_PLEPL|nr:unnamed protein product [Pleuronectes platessa]
MLLFLRDFLKTKWHRRLGCAHSLTADLSAFRVDLWTVAQVWILRAERTAVLLITPPSTSSSAQDQVSGLWGYDRRRYPGEVEGCGAAGQLLQERRSRDVRRLYARRCPWWCGAVAERGMAPVSRWSPTLHHRITPRSRMAPASPAHSRCHNSRVKSAW